MPDKYGQQIGGIKAQMAIVRARIAKVEFQVKAIGLSIALFYGTIIIIWLARSYG